MRLRLSLQWRVLLLLTGGMTLILFLSGYLHGVIASALIEDDRYNTAIGHTVALAGRIVAQQTFSNADELRREIVLVRDTLVRDARKDFAQIDVYQTAPDGVRRVATTAPDAEPLPVLDEHSADNELHEMERPVPGVVTREELRGKSRYWLITVAMKERTGTGFVSALVFKNSYNPLVQQLQSQHDWVLAGATVVCVGLSYLLFMYFFRRPARNIVQAMTVARGGNFGSRAVVRRDDELGEIARGFNEMMDDLSARDREREALLARISGFNDQLRGEVARATAELRAVNEALFQSQQRLGRSERLAAMGQVAASLAHEIGTPLNSISGHLQLLARRHPDDADMQRRVGIISQQLDFIVRSVRALLQRTHKRRAVLRRTDVNAALGETLRLVGPTLDTHGITVAAAFDPGLPAVMADRDSLHQVFLNLINNSVDAMPAGGRLELTTAIDDKGRRVEVTVRDTGPGIPAETIEHLFEPLWTTKPTGSGFGLAIAREIMIEHGGDIDVDRSAGSGATFRLHLPLADVAATV
jgi:two-component system, NtrC family, sensor kinase